jgi:hypothetical protein
MEEDQLYLRYCLVAAATIMQVTFPDYEQWYREAQQGQFGLAAYNDEKFRWDYSEEAESNTWDEYWDEAEDEELEALWKKHRLDLYEHVDDDTNWPAVPNESANDSGTVRNYGAHVGRNDPCPCGSGRKYKKCCLKRKSQR